MESVVGPSGVSVCSGDKVCECVFLKRNASQLDLIATGKHLLRFPQEKICASGVGIGETQCVGLYFAHKIGCDIRLAKVAKAFFRSKEAV